MIRAPKNCCGAQDAPWKKGAGCVNQPCSTRRPRHGSRVPSTTRTPCGIRGSNTVSWLKSGGTRVSRSFVSVPCTGKGQVERLSASQQHWDLHPPNRLVCHLTVFIGGLKGVLPGGLQGLCKQRLQACLGRKKGLQICEGRRRYSMVSQERTLLPCSSVASVCMGG